MLVASANDACEAVAWHVGGDDQRFVSMMNERARAMGLTNTHFANPCGFDAPGHYSTAADLAKLTEQSAATAVFSMMVRTLARDISTVDGGRQIVLHSTNELLVDPDVNGVKTGYTSKAGRCLIASMFKNGHRLLLVGLNLMDSGHRPRACFATVRRFFNERAVGAEAPWRLLASDHADMRIPEILLGEDRIRIESGRNAKFVDGAVPVPCMARRGTCPPLCGLALFGDFCDGIRPEQQPDLDRGTFRWYVKKQRTRAKPVAKAADPS